MRVRVRAFATLRDHLDAREVEVTVDEGASVGAVLAALEADYPGLEGKLLVDDRIPSTVTVLRNGKPVPADDAGSIALSAGDELVLAPPVTGG